MIAELIEILHSNEFYGLSENMEIVKGKNEKVYTWVDLKRKIKRIWLSRKL
jgi:hypothetical protein